MRLFQRHSKHDRFSPAVKGIGSLLSLALVLAPVNVQAQSISAGLDLPVPGVMVTPSAQFAPPIILGMTFHPENPLQFDFLVDEGNSALQRSELEAESLKLIKYFMAALTIPEDEQWVNLSPYEEDQIIPDALSHTEMGRDLLVQDYLLKQLTASLIYPEDDLGAEFWTRVYDKAQAEYGTTEIPVDTFNKVWVVPDSATVYEQGNNVLIVENRLKVMIEEDYMALEHNQKTDAKFQTSQGVVVEQDDVSAIGSQILKTIVLPEIEKEVNTGKNFAPLRQIYNSMLLATWYKFTLKESLLNAVYSNQNKLAGIDLNDPALKDKIYQQYLEAFRVGVYSYIKEDIDPLTDQMIPRKYFSGGAGNDYSADPVTGNIKRAEEPPTGTPDTDLSAVQVRLVGDQETALQEQLAQQAKAAASVRSVEISADEKAKYESILAQDRAKGYDIAITDRTGMIAKYDPHVLNALYTPQRLLQFRDLAEALAQDPRGLEVWHINTGLGGGVFDILNAFLAHSSGMEGFHQSYLTMGLDERMWFTKLIHNVFHGKEVIDGEQVKFTDEMKSTFKEVSRVNAAFLVKRIVEGKAKAPDFVMVHDPQPLLVMKTLEEDFPEFFKKYFSETHFLWFGHIPFQNVSVKGSASSQIWDFFLPYINWYGGKIFHTNQAIPRGIENEDTVFINTNSIDPLALINIHLPADAIEATKRHLDIPVQIKRLALQNARFDRLKDPLGVIEAASDWLEHNSDTGLVFMGPLASDDPEGMDVLTEVTVNAKLFNERIGRDAIIVRPFFPVDPRKEINAIENETLRMEKLTDMGKAKSRLESLGFVFDEMIPYMSPDMKAAAVQSGLSPDGWRPHDTLNFITNAMQTFAGQTGVVFMKSIEEGFGLAGAGAKLHGLAILGNTGGLGPQIEHGFNGFKVGIHGIGPEETVTAAMVEAKYQDIDKNWHLPKKMVDDIKKREFNPAWRLPQEAVDAIRQEVMETTPQEVLDAASQEDLDALVKDIVDAREKETLEEMSKRALTNRELSIMEAKYFLELTMGREFPSETIAVIKDRAKDNIMAQYTTLRQMEDMLNWFFATVEISKPQHHAIRTVAEFPEGAKIISAYHAYVDKTVYTMYFSDRVRPVIKMVDGNHTDLSASEMSALYEELVTAKNADAQDEIAAREPQVDPEQVGGIDLDPALLNLQIRRDRNGVPLPKWQQPLHEINIQGFTPVIMDITPVISVPMYLGQTAAPEDAEPDFYSQNTLWSIKEELV